jgi:hypothetical protein
MLRAGTAARGMEQFLTGKKLDIVLVLRCSCDQSLDVECTVVLRDTCRCYLRSVLAAGGAESKPA